MFELGLGVLFAFWFVAFYFIYRKVFSRDGLDAPRLPPSNTPELHGRHEPRFLNAQDLSEHHTGAPRPDDDFRR